MKNNELKLHHWCIYDSHKAKNANWDTYDSIESFKKIQQVVVNSELSFKKAEHSWRLRGAWACTGKQVDSLWKIIKGNNTGRIAGMTDPQKKNHSNVPRHWWDAQWLTGGKVINMWTSVTWQSQWEEFWETNYEGWWAWNSYHLVLQKIIPHRSRAGEQGFGCSLTIKVTTDRTILMSGPWK